MRPYTYVDTLDRYVASVCLGNPELAVHSCEVVTGKVAKHLVASGCQIHSHPATSSGRDSLTGALPVSGGCFAEAAALIDLSIATNGSRAHGL